MKGKFVVVDGIDGVGKAKGFLDVFIEEARKEGKRIFDIHEFWKIHDYHPPLQDILTQADVLYTSEPTFAGIGRYIREELIFKNQRSYSPEAVAQAYALDRHILYEQLLLPCLDAGKDIYQSRSLSTSIVYQRQSALDQGREFSIKDILAIPGNAFCYRHPMDHLVIPTIKNVEQALERLAQREKDDQSKFENLEFQLHVKPHYESQEFKDVFESVGTQVSYLDAGQTLDYSQQQARDFYGKYLRRMENI